MKARFWKLIALTLLCALIVAAASFIAADTPNVREQLYEYREWGMIAGSVVLFLGGVVGVVVFMKAEIRSSFQDQTRSDQRSNQRDEERYQTSQIDKFLKLKSKTLEGIERKIEQFLKDHPWIAGVTENGLLPNVPLCGLILTSAREYFESSDHNYGCTTEYIYSWFRADDGHASWWDRSKGSDEDNDRQRKQVIGTLDEFQDLVDFCRDVLRNDGLALRVLQQARKWHSSGIRLVPQICKMALARSDFKVARQAVEDLENILAKSRWHLEVFANRDERFLARNVSFVSESASALSLYYAAAGNARLERRYASQFGKSVKQLLRTETIYWNQLERALYAGRRQEVEDLIPKLSQQGSPPRGYEYLADIIPELRMRGVSEERVAG